MTPLPRTTRIAGTGSHLPAQRLGNDDLVRRLAARGIETSDAWIVERTGIRARHFAADGEQASDLALPACRRALEAAGRRADEVDLIVVATSTPDMVTVADALIRTGSARCALVVGSEVFSRILDFDDRTTCVLFGDGAGAVVLEASDAPGLLASALHADGRHAGILCVPGTVAGGQVRGRPLLKMDGQAVFKLAVGVLEDVARAVLARAGRSAADVDWLIPHQANLRIMQGTAKRLQVPAERVVVTVDAHGNTSAASIPLALDVAVRDGRIRRGDTLLLEGVGGGFTWGAVLLDY
jgi:3-oxoacyl-[acyl-carrier-protein] synthase-3